MHVLRFLPAAALLIMTGACTEAIDGPDDDPDALLDGMMAGRVWIDDGDGIYAPVSNDLPLSNIEVLLDGDSDFTTKTDADGRYGFAGLPLGSYDLSCPGCVARSCTIWSDRSHKVDVGIRDSIFDFIGRDESGPTTPALVTQGWDPTVSPDGNWVAFTRTVEGIARVQPSGAGLTVLTDFGWQPDWQTRGSLIAFLHGDSIFTKDAWTLALDLLRTGGIDDHPEWAPSDSLLVIESESQLLPATVDHPGGALAHRLCTMSGAGDCEVEGPTWSGDDLWIGFEDGLRLRKIPSTGGSALLLFEHPELWDVTQPAWSPNGRWVAFAMNDSTYSVSCKAGDFDCNPSVEFWHIWVVDASTGASQQITSGQSVDGNPAWSPGSCILYFDRSDPAWTFSAPPNRQIYRVGFAPSP